MGARGPKPKPDVLKALAGNPGQRPLNKAMPVPEGAPERPEHVTGYGVEVWDRILRSMPDALYGAVDTETLAAYCIAAATLREAVLHVNEDGAVAYSKEGSPYQNPWVSIQNRQIELIARLGGLLGLDPSSRSKLQAPEAPKRKPEGIAALIKSA